MLRPLLVLALLASLIAPVHPLPLDWLRRSVQSSSSDHSWLWSWLWAPDSTVTVVDRDNPVSFLSRPASFGADLKQPLLGYVIPLSAFTAPCSNGTAAPASASAAASAEPGPDDVTNLGCPELCVVGAHVPEPTVPWIALVQRGGCAFVDKAREAQRLGAKAVLVGGDRPSGVGNPDSLINMYDPGDSGDVAIAATFIRYTDYANLFTLIASSDTIHSGLRTVSLLIRSDTASTGWLSPVLTFIAILLLPSFLTFVTLMVHRVRMARAARLERAPENVVLNLPWRVWTGHGWEKHAGVLPGQEHPCTSPPPAAPGADLEAGILAPTVHDPDAATGGHPLPSSSHPEAGADADTDADEPPRPPWFETQFECAICLSEFAIGDRVRVLPCNHIFHLDEVDGWLINNKKLCPVCKADVTLPRAPWSPENAAVAVAAGEAQANPGAPLAEASTPTERTPLLRTDAASASRPAGT